MSGEKAVTIEYTRTWQQDNDTITPVQTLEVAHDQNKQKLRITVTETHLTSLTKAKVKRNTSLATLATSQIQTPKQNGSHYLHTPGGATGEIVARQIQ